MQKRHDMPPAEVKSAFVVPPNIPANAFLPNVLDEKAADLNDEAGEEQYGKDYAESADNHFVDRHTGKLAPEFAPFCLNPEESRSYYHRSNNPKTWTDIRILESNEQRLEPNKLYVSLTQNNVIEYRMTAPDGNTIRNRTDIFVAPPAIFNIAKAIELKTQILASALRAKHIPADPQTYYEGIPCENAYHSQINANLTVPEGHVGLIIENGKHKFLAPGSYTLPAGITFVRSERTDQKHIIHGTKHIVTVQGQELYQVTDPLKMDDFRILTQGRHVLDLPSGTIEAVQGVNDKVLWIGDLEKQKEEALKAAKFDAENTARVARGEKPKDAPNVPDGRKPGRVIFVKVPQGKVGVAYDNESQLRILKPGMCYLPPSWTFYDYISYKKQQQLVELDHVKTGDDITVKVKANAHYQIKNPYQAVREYGPNNIVKAIKDAAFSAVKIAINALNLFFKNSAQFDPLLPAPAYDAPPAEERIVHQMNKHLSAGKVNISEVNMISVVPADKQVEAALESASAAQVHVVAERTKLHAVDLELQILDRQLAAMEKRIALANRYVQHEQTVAQGLGTSLAEQAVATANVLGNNPVALEVYKHNSRNLLSQNRYAFVQPAAEAAAPAAVVHLPEEANANGNGF